MPRRNGFTLLEVVVALPILGVLIGLLLPAVSNVRDTAIRVKSTNNVRQIGIAVQNFASDHEGRLPNVLGDKNGPNPLTSVHTALLPYIEKGAWFQKLVTDRRRPPGGRPRSSART